MKGKRFPVRLIGAVIVSYRHGLNFGKGVKPDCMIGLSMNELSRPYGRFTGLRHKELFTQLL